MSSVAHTLLAYLLGGEYPRLERNDLAPFAFLDLHLTGTNRAGFGLRNKLDTGKRLAGLGRRSNNFRRRPTRTLRMPAQPDQ